MNVEEFRIVEEHFGKHGSALDRTIWSHAKTLNLRATLITDDNADPYLLRIYLTPHQDDEIGKPKRDRKLPGVFLHYFFRGDHDRELHNHPWKWAWSVILTKGYIEERLSRGAGLLGADIHYSRRIRVFGVNVIRQNDYHRVILDRGPCWTLFVAGPQVPAVRGEDWGFLDDDGHYLSWAAREAAKRAVVSPTPFV